MTYTPGLRPMTMPPFHDPQRNPLPDANDIEQEAANSLEPDTLQNKSSNRRSTASLEQDKQNLRKMFMWLIVIGLAAGTVLGVGIAIALKRLGFTDPPEPSRGSRYQRQQIEQLASGQACDTEANPNT